MGMNLKHYSILLFVLLWASCANRGIGPQGGPKDTEPPVPLKSEPEMGALNWNGDRIEVTFNEYLELDNVSENLLMSPPQQNAPEVKARGKRLLIRFQDSLQANTTYTLDFGEAVCDYRERVPLRGYHFYFATGPEIDTLDYCGKVFDASTLNPASGIIVGIHNDLEDSAFTTKPFLRIARTDTAGYFRIGNIHPGQYRLFAVEEASRDFRLTPGEALAFADEVIEVKAPEPDTIAPDTLAVDSLAQDSSIVVQRIDKNLFLFKEEQQKLYLQRTLRPDQHRIQILFSSKPDSLPELHPLTDSLNYHIQYSARRDTLTMWLLDSMSIAQDSLFFAIRYRRTDSIFQLEWASDTIRAIWRAPRLSAKAKEALDRKNRNRRLELSCNARTGFEIYDTLRLRCVTPLTAIERDSIHLFERVDSILKPMPFTMAPFDSLSHQLLFYAKFKPEGKYELHVDSGALHDVYGITQVKQTYAMQVKSLQDYSTIRIKLNPMVEKARIQVLNSKDEVLRELPATKEGAFFEYLKPDTYYFRMYIDENEDGRWTTGEWSSKRQPEPIYYFPGKLQTKSNWDFEEEWDYQAQEQTKVKPAELIIKPSSKR